MARTPAMQRALSNAWLTAQGLVSVKPCGARPRATRLSGFVQRANLLNRPLRTRTVGGVRPGAKYPGYPISLRWARGIYHSCSNLKPAGAEAVSYPDA